MKKYRVIIIIILSLIILNIILITPLGRSITTSCINTINSGLSFVKNQFNNVGEYFINNKKTSEENKRLEKENEALKNQIANIMSENNIIKNDNKQLQEFLDGNKQISAEAKNFNTNLKISNTTIISRNINTWNQEAIINGGKNQNYKVGQAVVNNGYLIGFINDVYDNISKVELLNVASKELNIPIMVCDNDKNINGIIKYYDETNNTFLIEILNLQDKITIGDIVYTNGYQNEVPIGIKLGSVEKVIPNNQTGTILYSVKGNQNIANIKEIGVISNE